jgi:hypothetical protein
MAQRRRSDELLGRLTEGSMSLSPGLGWSDGRIHRTGTHSQFTSRSSRKRRRPGVPGLIRARKGVFQRRLQQHLREGVVQTPQ